MNILITGGSGYIGSKLAIALKEAGNTVENFDRPQDILNEEQLEHALDGKDAVYHLAALAEINYTDRHPQETFNANIVGTNNIAKICARRGITLNFASTCCIYGDPLEVPSMEDRLINPTDAYAMSKAAAEYLIKMWGLTSGLKFNILRFGTVYGPGTNKEQRGDMCIQKFLQAAIEGKSIVITGDGKQERNFIHIDDLVRGLVLVVDKGVIGQTINLAGKEKISIKAIADYAQDFGASERIYIKPRKDDFMRQDVSLAKAYELLGWSPEITFEEGITSTLKWLQQ